MKNEKGEAATGKTEIPRIVRDCYEQLYGNKMDNGQILRKVQSSKTEARRNRNCEQSNYKH